MKHQKPHIRTSRKGKKFRAGKGVAKARVRSMARIHNRAMWESNEEKQRVMRQKENRTMSQIESGDATRVYGGRNDFEAGYNAALHDTGLATPNYHRRTKSGSWGLDWKKVKRK